MCPLLWNRCYYFSKHPPLLYQEYLHIYYVQYRTVHAYVNSWNTLNIAIVLFCNPTTQSIKIFIHPIALPNHVHDNHFRGHEAKPSVNRRRQIKEIIQIPCNPQNASYLIPVPQFNSEFLELRARTR